MEPNSPADESISLPESTEAPLPETNAQPLDESPSAAEIPPTEELQPSDPQAEESPQAAAAPSEPDAVQEIRPDQAAATETPEDPLAVLADRALKGRLSPQDEERTIALVKEALLDGRKGVERAVGQLPKLPWVVGVSGVSAAWPEMKTTFRARLIGGLAKSDNDATRRVRLSLARGLFKLDVPAAMKLATGVAKEMRDKETGSIPPKSAQIFANVLIGRAKPWVAQIALAEMKPADADLLVHCALLSVFGMPHAPATQLGVLKWAAGAGRLTKLHPLALEIVLKSVGRWSGKWQGVLRKEVKELPEEISNALKPHSPAPPPPRRREPQENLETAGPGEEAEPGADLQEREARADESETPRDEPHEPETGGSDEDEDAEDKNEDEDEDENEDEATDDLPPPSGRHQDGSGQHRPQQQRQRPVYESKTVPSQQQQPQRRQTQSGNFNLTDALRQIEGHVAGLRSELHAAQSKLRQREDELRKPRRGVPERSAGTIVHGEPTLEELARLNRQLEARNAELQAHIEELASDSEDRAAAASLSVPEAAVTPDAQLKALLSLKLQEDYEDFAALEKEAPDLVVQQHYRTVLRHVFDVLRSEGVPLNEGPPLP